ncbi:hypothetical protein TBLA_0B00920 [Henningerozyma blattae CBS 6284]|uniref:Chitin synthase export chaperone n=1 Tax=Henningerozyma blattae (strain ATCC 34711 / CBS 6284 / DSM 70876 / NBRC 10599 / NRRL Y-10934 / UCD 77-7) TaxID=1071380 RepID=I2GXT3_HENB6|nr:hypothetical protein TBLA_0B00920 [Tetrapisispora blattae CBS 6284]CCH58935.1 hypothetical protein TBLA_0B00920 [Tetrapisispora blattae CBS 6284]
MGVSNFATLCSRVPLPLCSVIKSTKHLVATNSTIVDNFDIKSLNVGILPRCYARSIELSNTIIFQVGNAFINIGALGVILIILYNIKQKFTAIGRSEYLYFFETMFMTIMFTLVVNCGVSPPGSASYPYFVAIQIGLAGAACWSLLIIGFLGFNLWEDGTTKSMTLVRGFSVLGFIANFLAAILTFKNWIEQGRIPNTDTTAFFAVVYVLNLVILFTYTVCQVLVSIYVVRNLWVTGAIFLGVAFFTIGQVVVYRFSVEVCEGVTHYLDGLFFGSICNIFTLMMLYKTWDMTTDDDLEFGVSVSKDGEVVYT